MKPSNKKPRQIVLTPGQVVVFNYTNWRAEEHAYVVRIETLEYDDGFTLSGRCLLRDGQPRLEPDSLGDGTHAPRRTFELGTIRDFVVLI